MANPWFRMYHEFATDPKVQMLSESDQRRFVMLLCLCCSNDGETLHDVAVAFQLRISNEEYAQTKDTLMDAGLIDEHNKPLAWDKRQFASDSSTARVRAYREKKKQQRNVTETKSNALDTDTDTDTEVNKPPSSKGAITLRKWLEKIKQAGESAIPTGDTIFDWCDDAGIPHEFLTIAWIEFKNRFEPTDKRQKDWRQHFRNAVRGNWFGFWYMAEGQTLLTTKGHAAMRVLEAEQRRAS